VDGSGVITAYTPGTDYISFRTETSTAPVKYYYTKTTTIVDSDGKTVEWTMLKPDMPVKYTYIKDGDRKIVTAGKREIGVFHKGGDFYAYSNTCLHQGGPACEGLTIAKVEERLRPDMTSQGLYFSETQMNFVCPWHGMEYDMKTGECISDRKLKLKKFQVLEKGDEVYVVA